MLQGQGPHPWPCSWTGNPPLPSSFLEGKAGEDIVADPAGHRGEDVREGRGPVQTCIQPCIPSTTFGP